MKLTITGDPAEIREKGAKLVKAVASRVLPPQAMERLEKALQADDKPSATGQRYPGLQAIQDEVRTRYERRMAQMVAEIGKVLDEPRQHGPEAPKDPGKQRDEAAAEPEPEVYDHSEVAIEMDRRVMDADA